MGMEVNYTFLRGLSFIFFTKNRFNKQNSTEYNEVYLKTIGELEVIYFNGFRIYQLKNQNITQ